MKNTIFFSFLLTIAMVAGNVYGANETPAQASQPLKEAKDEAEIQDLKADQIALISEAFGHMLAQHIRTLGINFDVAQLVKGLQDAHQGKASPMDEMKCIEALTQARQQAFLHLAKKNLQDAEQYLQQTAQKDGIHSLEAGKLYYRIDRNGEGESVAEGNTPLIRYKGSFIDGTVFGASQEDDLVTLDETIPGFSRGLLGMKEGEKRTLYIHPELAYGTNGQLPPNSLLVFEIELVKANSAEGSTHSITSTQPAASTEKEISQNHPAPTGEAEAAIR